MSGTLKEKVLPMSESAMRMRIAEMRREQERALWASQVALSRGFFPDHDAVQTANVYGMRAEVALLRKSPSTWWYMMVVNRLEQKILSPSDVGTSDEELQKLFKASVIADAKELLKFARQGKDVWHSASFELHDLPTYLRMARVTPKEAGTSWDELKSLGVERDTAILPPPPPVVDLDEERVERGVLLWASRFFKSIFWP